MRVAFGARARRPTGRYVARPVGGPGSRAAAPATHRRPSYGGQARRQASYLPYALAFAVIIVALGGFLYLGLNWASGAGRTAALGASPAPAPALAPPLLPSPGPAASPVASPVAERSYTVKPGDTPGAIAREFGITVEALLRANNIQDPRTLQVGQTLQIPPASP